MSKKIASLAVVAVMLVQSAASAAGLSDFVTSTYDGRGVLTDFESKRVYCNSENVEPDMITRVATAGGSYAEHPVSNPLTSTNGTFDYEAELDMSKVKTAFTNLDLTTQYALTKRARTDLLDDFNASVVTGEFTITVTYDNRLTANTANFVFSQVGNASPIFTQTAMTPGDGTLTVKYKVNDDITIENLRTNKDKYLANLKMQLSGVTASVKNSAHNVSASMTGYIVVRDGTEPFGKINFASDNTKNTASVFVVEPSSPGGSPVSSSEPRAFTVVDGTQKEIIVKKVNGKLTIVLSEIETPTKDGYVFDGWYLDKEMTQKVEENLVIKNDTYLYAKFVEKAPAPVEDNTLTTVVDGQETKIEITEKDGKQVADLSQIPVPQKQGFVFDGWSLSPNMTNPVSGEIEVSGDMKLYPRYINITAPAELISEQHNAYISGYPDGEVKPNGMITREEVAFAFYRLLKPEYIEKYETDDVKFPDVEKDRWSAKAIATLANAGYIVGDDEGNFNPANNITRAEFATIASKFAPEDANLGENIFSDVTGHWAENAILVVTGQCWISGYEDGTFRPNNNITRAEAMTIINKMLVRYGDETAENIKQWPDVDKDDWFYGAVIEATNDNEFIRNEDRWSETWTDAE